MATVIEELSLKGMKRADLAQLLEYIFQVEEVDVYWGNKEQWQKRHNRIKECLEKAVETAYSEGNRLPGDKR